MNKNISWDYMVSWLKNPKRHEDVSKIAMFSAKNVGTVRQGIVHKNLTKPVEN